MEAIRSAANAHIKRVRAVRAGKEPELILLEGRRLVEDAVGSGLALELLFVSEARRELLENFERGLLVDTELLDRISELKTSPGILALARRPVRRDVTGLGEALGGCEAAPLVVVVDGVADPINLGALARSAEAAGAAALVCVAGGAGPFGPRALRGSMGSLLRMVVLEAESVEAARQAVEGCGLRIVRPDTRGGVDWRAVDWSPPVALWIGGETRAAEIGGLGVTIPMAGGVESLNVGVAASLLMFAAGRTPRGARS
jgi:tRNA G18 (ribose-2'-O)-methylase SpoU